jgi:hypothetical protein
MFLEVLFSTTTTTIQIKANESKYTTMESSSANTNMTSAYEYEDELHNFYDFTECITKIHFAYPEMPYNQRLVRALDEYEKWSVSTEKLILINKLSQEWIDKAMEYVNSTQLVLSDLSFSDTRIHSFDCCERCEGNESFHKEEWIEHKLRELNEDANAHAHDEVAYANDEVEYTSDYRTNKKNNDFNIVNRVQKKENKNKKRKEIKNKTEIKTNMNKQLNKIEKKRATQFALDKISTSNFNFTVDVDIELGDVSKENHIVFTKPSKNQRRQMDKSRHKERNSKNSTICI